MTTRFDTLAFAEALEGTGLSQSRREALTRAIHDVAMSEIVTRADLTKEAQSIVFRLGVIVVASATIMTAVLGLLISLK